MWQGQFIGLTALILSSSRSTVTKNMFWRKFSQWPDRSQKARSSTSGVRTSW